MVTLTDKEYLAHVYAGLTVWGLNEDGQVEWVGTPEQWKLAEVYINDEGFPENHYRYLLETL